MFWPKLSHKEIEELVFKGLDENLKDKANETFKSIFGKKKKKAIGRLWLQNHGTA